MSKRVLGLAVLLVLVQSLGGFAQEPGDVKWSYCINSYEEPSIGLNGNILVDVGGRCELSISFKDFHSFYPDGSMEWGIRATSSRGYSAVGADGTIYHASGAAINPDGTEKWKLAEVASAASPAIDAEGVVYTVNSRINAVRPDGTVKWSRWIGYSGRSAPAISEDGTIYFGGGYHPSFHAYSLDGTRRWIFHTDGSVYSSPAIASDGTVYVGSTDGYLYAINPDGTLKWKFDTGGEVWTSPVIGYQDTIFLAGGAGDVYAINPDGSLKWMFPTWWPMSSSPVIGADGTIYVGNNRRLHALRSDGTQRWSKYLDDGVQTPLTMGLDGTLYFYGWGGFYAVHTDSSGPADTPWPMYGQNAQHTGRRIPPPSPIHVGETVEAPITPWGNHRFALDAEGGQNLLVELVPTSGIESMLLNAAFGVTAYPAGGHLSTRVPTPRGRYELVIGPTHEGTYFLSLLGFAVDDAGGTYTLRASYVNRYLSDLLTRTAGNGGQVDLSIRGLGFEQGMNVKLEGPGVPSLTAEFVKAGSTADLIARFDLTGTQVGVYDLVVTWPDSYSETLESAFTVTPGIGPRLEVELEAPLAVRAGRKYTAWLEYKNTGDADMPAPLFSVRSNTPISTRQDSIDGLRIEVLGVGGSGSPEVVRVGERCRIPIFFRSLRDGTPPTFLVVVAEDTATPIDWAAQEEIMRPPGMDPAEWNALWPDLMARLGDTWAEYIDVLRAWAARTGERGLAVHDVRRLVAFDTRLAAGQPVTSISGTLLHGTEHVPMAGVTVRAVSVDGTVVRDAVTEDHPEGLFVIENLPSGIYELYVKGYYFDPTPVVDVVDDDVTGLILDAYEYPLQPEPEEIGTPRHDPSVARTEVGELYMVWQEGNEIWWARETSGSWEDSGPIPDAAGVNPIVIHDAYLLDEGASAGLLVAWESDDTPTVIEWVVGRPTNDGVDWSAPQALTGDSFDDFSIAMTADDTGTPLILWLQRDLLVDDDSDLYYGFVDVDGVEILKSRVSFASSNPAFGSIFEGCLGVPDLQFGRTLPTWIPVIGGNYFLRMHGEACVSGVCDLGMEGVAGLRAILSRYVDAEGEFNVDGNWTTDRESCANVFSDATVSGSFGFEAFPSIQIPIPSPPALPLGWAKLGGVFGGSVTGSLTWRSHFGGWPDSGELRPTFTAGLQGVIDMFAEGLAGEVRGTAIMNSVYTPRKGFHFEGQCVRLEGTIKAGWGLWKMTWETTWGDTCGKRLHTLDGFEVLESTEKRFAIFDSYTLDEIPISESLVYEKTPFFGTGATYEGIPVLVDISGDLFNDGSPAVARSAMGEVIVVWSKDVEAELLGGRFYAATLDGGGWSAPVEITTEVDFVKDSAVVFDSGGSLVVVWSSASNSGLDYDLSTVEEIVAASEVADLAYAVRTGGVWSTPAIIAELTGTDDSPMLAAGPAGEIVVVWLNRGEDDTVIFASFRDGAVWSEPAIIASAIVVDPPVVVFDDVGPVIIWAQDGDDLINTNDNWKLVESRWDGISWSNPVEPVPQPAAAKSCQVAPRTRATLAKSVGLGPPPPECCDEEGEDDEPQPPEPPGEEVERRTSSVIRSADPNEKLAVPGFGDQHLIDAGIELPYEVHFENLATATAPAQEVFVTDCLDRNLDWLSFRFSDVVFGDTIVANTTTGPVFEERVTILDYRSGEEKDWWVDVTTSFDLVTGCFEMTLGQLDPETGELPLDPYAGILPPEDGSGRGQGHLSYTVDAKDDLEDGRVIRNRAKIVFDYNEPIWTNEVFNTIGDPQFTLNISIAGDGSGSVTSTPGSIDCGNICEAMYIEGTEVELNHFAEDGSEFSAWGGDADCADGLVTMSADVSCSAAFVYVANEPPVADAGEDQFLAADAQCEAAAVLDGSQSYDPDDDPLSYLWQSAFGEGDEAVFETVLSLGAHEFTLTVTDDQDASDSDTVSVTVEDGTPPIIELSGDPEMTLECMQPYTEPGANALDNCDVEVQVAIGGEAVDHTSPGFYAVTYDAADALGNQADTFTRTVSVVDTTIPAVTAIEASPSSLWPPNHKMTGVTISVSAADSCDTELPICEITGVASNEPETGCGAGNKQPDWLATGDLTVDLRAERCGQGDDRIYTIEVTCEDATGNSSHATTEVRVPHDQGKKPRRGGGRSKPG